MAKKSIKALINEANQRLDQLDQQAKSIQDEKKKVRQDLKILNDQLVTQLGRQLLTKFNLEEDNPEAIDAAFAKLDNLHDSDRGGAS
ncbi:hypothetical protein FGL72_04500 [Leuconostoc citreum]|uniref:hypothetical protein n=1 Tax=Leuconostoc citreum TaxID=33964 RepID=UPI00111FDAD3|nr:hypothetical protein [Leuconostoc citreum]QEA46412.1 hypothetical protein FGL82_08565 [Leuconostoc citreum]QEA63102.1 hypothetical protein FGL72_04500 [Leuconostoc citreum]TOY70459.1 hypothetical protein DIS12_03060 [Leuconostoc citreum]